MFVGRKLTAHSFRVRGHMQGSGVRGQVASACVSRMFEMAIMFCQRTFVFGLDVYVCLGEMELV